MSKIQKPLAGDIFCGVGGMSLGFEQAGFEIGFGIDNDPIHIHTYSDNFPKSVTICTDVSSTSGDELLSKLDKKNRSIDVLFGGPPCEGFSLIGNRRIDDPRNKRLYEFARLVNELKPKYFVVENVQGILMGNARVTVAKFLVSLRNSGYSVVLPVRALDARDYGVPQRRIRIFFLGFKKGLPPPNYPTPNNDAITPTVWDAIGDLPNADEFDELIKSDCFIGELGVASDYAKELRGENVDPENNSRENIIGLKSISGFLRTAHTPKTISRFESTEPGEYEPVSRFYRLTKDGVAPTLRSGSDKDHGSYTAPRPIHPVFPRCITVREAARLQTFPDWFNFHSTKWHGFRQVGNSVPPLLAKAVATSILETLKMDRIDDLKG